MKLSLFYIIFDNNQHRTITLSASEDNLQFIPNVKCNLAPSHKNLLSVKSPMPYPKKRLGTDFTEVAIHTDNLNEPTDAFIE